MSNPNNYPGAEASIVGWAAADAAPPKYDTDGSKGLIEIRVPVNEGYKKEGEFVQTGTTWYSYVGGGEFAENVLAGVKKGDKVRIDNAKQEVREYTDKEGNVKMGITLRFGDFTVLESKGPF